MSHHSPRADEQRPWNWPMFAQAGYYIITGLWPLAHMRSFEALTGPKPDRFVVESTGLLFAATGATLVAAAADGGRDRVARVLSALVPAGATLAALRHRPRLRAVYLADAAVQAALAACVWRQQPQSGDASSTTRS